MNSFHPTRTGLINMYSRNNIGDAAIYAAYARLLKSENSVLIEPGNPEYASSDAYVSAGGDVFNNARPYLVTRRFLRNIVDLRRAPAARTFAFGQSIPRSCRGMALRLLARTLSGISSVCVRDAESHRRLTSVGVDATLSADVAFALAPTQQGHWQAMKLFRALDLDPVKTAILSVREFNTMYPQDNKRFSATIERLCARLIGAGLQPAIMLQSRTHPIGDDRLIASRIAGRVPSVRILDPWGTDQGTSAVDCAIGAAAAAHLVVGVRFHTSVFRMLSGRSAYNLYYSNKGADLVERFGEPGCALDDFDPERELPAILRSAGRRFDIAPLRARVTQDFNHAINQALRPAAAGAQRIVHAC